MFAIIFMLTLHSTHVHVRKNAQLVFACSQTWTWLSWPAWTVLLTGLNTVELASWNSVVDRLVHACWNRLFMAWWTNWLEQRCNGTIMINQQRCSYMIEHVVKEWWLNNKIEQQCYNYHELRCCIKSSFACSNVREQPQSNRM